MPLYFVKYYSKGWKYNPYSYPIGRVFIDGWILEMVDLYKENYSIPSTRCTRVVAVDYAGSIPVTMNSMINTTLPRLFVSKRSDFIVIDMVTCYCHGSTGSPSALLRRVLRGGVTVLEGQGF